MLRKIASGGELSALFAARVELGKFAVEEDHRFTQGKARFD
jgi:hypothetical protein